MSQLISNKTFSSKNNESVFDVYEIQYDVQLAANIINMRTKLGMTQEQLAQKIKAVQPAIARAENGNNPPSHKLLKKIAKAFGARLVPPNFLLQISVGDAVRLAYETADAMLKAREE